MSEEIKFDHFKDINELLEHIDLWYREDDIEYTRWFGLEDLHILKIYITSLQQKVEQLEKENISLKEANNYHQEVIKSMKEPENAHHYHLENIKLRAINNQLENIRKEVIEYLTSYESISTIQGLNDIEKNKILDEKTMNEMVNRYLKVHDILLNILNKGEKNGK